MIADEEAERIYNDMRDDFPIDVDSFDSSESLEDYVRNLLNSHDKLSRLGDVSKSKIVDKFLNEWEKMMERKRLKEMKESKIEELVPPKKELGQVPTVEIPEVPMEEQYPPVSFTEEETKLIQDLEKRLAERASPVRIANIVNNAVSKVVNAVKGVVEWVKSRVKGK